jgi:hypothetical protein
MSRFEIRCEDVVLGHSQFESADESMGVRIGRFVPATAYSQFQNRFAQEQQTRETLALPLGIFHGETQIPTRWVHILDYSADLGVDTGIEVSAHLPDYESYRALFETHAA